MNPQPIITLSTDSVNKLLVDFFTQFFEWENGRVLIETRAGPRPPDGAYLTLWWKNLDLLKQSVGEFTRPESDAEQGTTRLDNETHCTIQVTVRGDNALTLCNEARSILEDPQRFFDLWQLLGFAGCEPVQDLSAVFGGQIQQRAFFNFNFYALYGRGYPADWFDTSKWVINNQEHTMKGNYGEPDCM